MHIADNKVVTLTYELHANLPSEKERHIETADKSSPLQFLFGAGMMIPGFEKGVAGKSAGDQFDFIINSDEGYGDNDETAVVNLPIDIFKVDNVIDFQMLKAGNTLPMSDNHGNVLHGKVISYDDTAVKMDFNHPLAGHSLHFKGTILDVRDASADEIAHGHVH